MPFAGCAAKQGLGLVDGTRDFPGPRDSVRRRGCSDNRRAGLGADESRRSSFEGVRLVGFFGGRPLQARKSGQEDRGRGFVRGSCSSCRSRQAMPGGGSSGARATRVKPSSEGSEGSGAKSIGSSRGVERRRTRKHLFGGPGGQGVLVRDKASTLTGRRWKRAWPKRRKGSRKSALTEVEATGRQRFGLKRAPTSRRDSRVTSGPPKPGVSP